LNIKLKLILYAVLISVSSVGFAVDNGTWTYEVNSDNTSITITGTSGDTPIDLVIPDVTDDYDVRGIGKEAFFDGAEKTLIPKDQDHN
jgi:hypothetical protein